ncbi:MAG: hypothetical protein H0Z24_03430 [Thermosipho sp. (in: Bacteria)]|nr:hypothetical protein [Thermosipho sp. (in: thermotogales)]
MEKKLLLCTVFFLLLSILPAAQAFAQNEDAIQQKLEEQHEIILEKFKNAKPFSDTEDKFNSLMQNFKKTQESSDVTTSKEQVIHNLKAKIYDLSLSSRKYVVPAYMIIVAVNTILLSTLGSRSLIQRRKYILSLISFTILFVVVINLPLIILYFQSNPSSELLEADKMYQAAFAFVYSLKRNSIAISILVLVYGLVLQLLGKNDIPKKILSQYLIKIAIILFVVLQALPIIVHLIL